MTHNQDFITLWANDRKRRDFLKDFKSWGKWFTQPELDLTFYKYDLPGGSRIIAMEYLRSPYPSETLTGNKKAVANNKYYLQRGTYFNPSAVSEHEIAE
jgi:hypothetical protein